jgi:hypothetical protein
MRLAVAACRASGVLLGRDCGTGGGFMPQLLIELPGFSKHSLGWLGFCVILHYDELLPLQQMAQQLWLKTGFN